MPNPRSGLCLLSWLVLIAAPVWSQTPASSPPAADNYAGEPFVIEHLQTVVRFEADGKGSRRTVLRVRVQSESAVRQFGLLVYPYMASFESLDIHARVRKADGTVVETSGDEIQDLDSAVSREAPMYTDQREKHVAVKSLAIGDTLEWDALWTIHDPLAPGHFWFDDNFFDQGICLDESLEFNLPADVPVKLVAGNLSPETKQEGSRRIYIFHSSHLDTKKQSSPEDEIPQWEKDAKGKQPPALRLSSFTSWADVGAWYGGLQAPRVEVTPKIRAAAEEITRGKTTEDEKIRALYDHVSSRFRYIGIDLGYGRYAPHAADDVLANRYGDCKDKHTLFAALLEAVGVHAYPALISSTYKLDPAMPSPDLFDHVITAIPQGDSFLFLDTTPEVAPYGLLLAGLRDRRVLVIPTDGSAILAKTPPDPPMMNHEDFRIEAVLDAKGTLDGQVKLDDVGDGEVALRTMYRNTAQNQWPELTQSLVSRMGFAGTVKDVAAMQPEKTSGAFWMSYEYHRPSYGDWENRRITLPLPPLVLPELNEAQKKSKDPLPLGSPQEISYVASLKLPAGALPVLPASVHQETDFADYQATYSLENGLMRGERHLTIKRREVPGAERAAYVAFVKSLRDDQERWIFLGGDFDAGSPLKKSSELLNEGKISEAVALLEKAAADTPENMGLTFALGDAYLRLPDEKKADEQFQKVLAANSSADMLNDVAYEYADANVRLSDALDYATRAVNETSEASAKIDLEGVSAQDFSLMIKLAHEWDTLGWVKFRIGDAASAERFLVAAWALSQEAVIGEHLAEVYEKLGRRRDADRVCRLALSAPGMTRPSRVKDKLVAVRKRIGLSRSEAAKVANGFPPPLADGADLSEMRAVKIPRKFTITEGVKNAAFIVLLKNGQRTVDVKFVNGDQDLKIQAASLARADFRQPFPDATPARIFHAGLLSCSKYTQECTYVWFQAPDVGLLAPASAQN